MATPVNDTYSAASGMTMYAGRSGGPAWAASAQLFNPMIVPSSAGFGGTTGISDYGGFGINQITGELFSLLNGGHAGSSDNRVASFPLMDDSPVWVVRNQPTPAGQRLIDVPYNTDGKPAARHMYDTAHFIEQLGRFVIAGMSGLSGNGNTSGATDSFDPVTNLWDAAGTWPSTDGNTGHGYDPTRGHIWTNSGQRYNAITKTISTPIANLGADKQCRFPTIHDPVHDVMFCLCFGINWSGSGQALNATKWNADGLSLAQSITFTSSDGALTQFMADQSAIPGGSTLFGSGMTYDHANGCFYWYNGTGATTGHMYKIVPNSGTVWEMSLFPWVVGATALPQTIGSGLNGCIKYVKKLKGFVIAPHPPSVTQSYGDLYFVRTS